MSTATSKQAMHTMAVIEQQNPSKEDYEVLHAGYLAAVVQAAKRGKLPELSAFRRAIGLGVLSLTEPHIHCPASAPFRISDRFVVDTSAPVPISHLNENWKLWFGGMEVPAGNACDLEVHALAENSLDKSIINEVGEELCDTSPAALWSMMSGGHLSQGKWYLLYMRDTKCVRRAVRVNSFRGSWSVCAHSASSLREWDDGDYVISRKHRGVSS